MGASTPGSQALDLPFQSHCQAQGPGLNKSSSSPELQTLPEAFAKAALESETLAEPSLSGPHVEEKVEGTTGGDLDGLEGQGGEGVPSSQGGGARMRLEFPAAAQQPGPVSPNAGHRPRGHTISVSAPSSRRERRAERDSYHSRPGNTEKLCGLSPRFLSHEAAACLCWWRLGLSFCLCLQLRLPAALPLALLWERSQQAAAAAQNSGELTLDRPEARSSPGFTVFPPCSR